MAKLALPILPWVLTRFVEIDLTGGAATSASAAAASSQQQQQQVTSSSSKALAVAKALSAVSIAGVDEIGIPYSWIKSVVCGTLASDSGAFVPMSTNGASTSVKSQPLYGPLRVSVEQPAPGLAFELKPFENCGETPVVVQFPANATSLRCRFALSFHAADRKWTYTSQCL